MGLYRKRGRRPGRHCHHIHMGTVVRVVAPLVDGVVGGLPGSALFAVGTQCDTDGFSSDGTTEVALSNNLDGQMTVGRVGRQTRALSTHRAAVNDAGEAAASRAQRSASIEPGAEAATRLRHILTGPEKTDRSEIPGPGSETETVAVSFAGDYVPSTTGPFIGQPLGNGSLLQPCDVSQPLKDWYA